MIWLLLIADNSVFGSQDRFVLDYNLPSNTVINPLCGYDDKQYCCGYSQRDCCYWCSRDAYCGVWYPTRQLDGQLEDTCPCCCSCCHKGEISDQALICCCDSYNPNNYYVQRNKITTQIALGGEMVQAQQWRNGKNECVACCVKPYKGTQLDITEQEIVVRHIDQAKSLSIYCCCRVPSLQTTQDVTSFSLLSDQGSLQVKRLANETLRIFLALRSVKPIPHILIAPGEEATVAQENRELDAIAFEADRIFPPPSSHEDIQSNRADMGTRSQSLVSTDTDSVSDLGLQGEGGNNQYFQRDEDIVGFAEAAAVFNNVLRQNNEALLGENNSFSSSSTRSVSAMSHSLTPESAASGDTERSISRTSTQSFVDEDELRRNLRRVNASKDLRAYRDNDAAVIAAAAGDYQSE